MIIFNRLLLFFNTIPYQMGQLQEGACKQNDICSASCLTNDGPAAGSACVFPFNYMGVSHTGCTTIDGDTTPWCSTMTDENNDHVSGVGAWGYCDASCPVQGLENWKIFEVCIGSNFLSNFPFLRGRIRFWTNHWIWLWIIHWIRLWVLKSCSQLFLPAI